MSASKPSACAQCGARSWRRVVHQHQGVSSVVVPAQRELPAHVEDRDEQRVVHPSSRWECKKCAYRAGDTVAWTGLDGPADGDFANFHAIIDAAYLPDSDADLVELEAFALSFDGWAAFGHRQSGVLARRLREDFAKRGVLPRNLALLRNTFFDEQVVRHRPPDAALLSALLEAIGAELAPERRTADQFAQR